MDNKKLCPFCGETHDSVVITSIVGYDNDGNPIKGEGRIAYHLTCQGKPDVYIFNYDSRPIEDELKEEIKRVESIASKYIDLTTEQRETIEFLESEILQDHKAFRDLCDMEARPSINFRAKFPELCAKIDEIYDKR